MLIPFTIVISTYNRRELLERCIDSIVKQNYPSYEILVVDDCSKYSSEQYINNKYENIKYIYLKENGGPCKARNIGINLAENDWIIIMDDDDTMEDSSLETISKNMSNINHTNYPVLNFARSNGRIKGESYKIVNIRDYINKDIRGEFVPVIQKDLFLQKGYKYPEISVGGESVLWMEIAKEDGIPTWAVNVCSLNNDADYRLTDTKHQIRKSNEYAKLQEILISKYKQDYILYNKTELYKRYKAAMLYHLLSGNKRKSLSNLKNLIYYKPLFMYLCIFTFLPTPLYAQLLLTYRKLKVR
ncbi:glycosyltransferase family 2 protein [Priestia filamentosa]|uniref:glycosyltransferase family 2 protein n=1 Tax=Priestia filamentosa TaxID=1402861 RepID=UPI003D2C0A33